MNTEPAPFLFEERSPIAPWAGRIEGAELGRRRGGHGGILERIATGAPLAGTLDELVRLVEAEIPGALGSLLLLDADGLHVHCASCLSLPAEYNAAIDGLPIGPSVGSCGTAAYRREPVFVEDIATDALWADYRDFALGHGLRACWSTPIISRRSAQETKVLGTFAVYFRAPRAPDERSREILAQAEYLACIAIDTDRSVGQLRATEARFRAFVDHATDAFFVHDFETGTIVDVNLQACSTLGYSREELIGADVRLFDPETTRERLVAVLGQQPITFETRHRRKDGSTLPVELRVSAFEVDGKRYALALARDVTQRRALEEQLRQALKMEAMGRLAGGVAHDFNNLLTVINGFSEMLLAETLDGAPGRSDLEAIRDAGERAAALTAQLLAFSRRTIVEPRPLKSRTIAGKVAKMLDRIIGEHIRIDLRLDDSSLVLADATHLEQVLVNLVLNAKDAMPLGGQLTLETGDVVRISTQTGKPRRYVRIAVSDTGEGMTDAVRSRIFEPFYTTKTLGKGTGLGLATVYAIVQQAGGDIEVESHLGRGSSFVVLLPALDGVEMESPREPEVAPRGTETVLLVEDEDAVRRLAQRALVSYGYVVLEARGGDEALRIEAAHEGPLDLLVTDVVMPTMGGRDVADAIRTRRPAVRVLYVSGYTDDEVVRHGVYQAEDAFLQKPYTPLGLATKVRAVLDDGAAEKPPEGKSC